MAKEVKYSYTTYPDAEFRWDIISPGSVTPTGSYAQIVNQQMQTMTQIYTSPLHGPTSDPHQYFVDVVMKETNGNRGKTMGWGVQFLSAIKNDPNNVLNHLRGSGKMEAATIVVEPPPMTPAKIKAELDRWVIGQEGAKKALAVAAYNHYERAGHNLKQTDKKALRMAKSNVVLIGPTGSGKTLLVQTLAKILDKPIVISDATDLTPEGYVGASAEDCLRDLYVAAGNDQKKAETGIVFIDEIDKLAYGASSPGSGPIKGLGSQQSLLKFVAS